MISIWEKTVLLNYDVIIIGAGISGLSTAASLKERSPHLSIVILERGSLPTGASTKNAGFACFGSLSELSEDRRILGDEGMQQLVEMRWKGLEKTRRRLGDANIDFEACGGYELIKLPSNDTIEEIRYTNTLLTDIIGKDVFSFQNQQISPFGFNKVQQLIFNPYEGALNSGKLIGALWDYCAQLGIRIITGTRVEAIHPEVEHVMVKTGKNEFKAKRLAICTNAFSHPLIKEGIDLQPGRGMVTYIKTEKPVRFKGTFHYNQGFFYFRHFGKGLLFGGGRNLDKTKEETTEFGINPQIRKQLIADLEDMIIPGQKYMIDMMWSGIMAFGKDKKPIIQKIQDQVFAGIRLGGMGIAIGSMVGETLASLIIKDLHQ